MKQYLMTTFPRLSSKRALRIHHPLLSCLLTRIRKALPWHCYEPLTLLKKTEPAKTALSSRSPRISKITTHNHYYRELNTHLKLKLSHHYTTSLIQTNNNQQSTAKRLNKSTNQQLLIIKQTKALKLSFSSNQSCYNSLQNTQLKTKNTRYINKTYHSPSYTTVALNSNTLRQEIEQKSKLTYNFIKNISEDEQDNKRLTKRLRSKDLSSRSSLITISNPPNQLKTVYAYKKSHKYTDLYRENNSNKTLSNTQIDQNLKKLNKRKNKQSTYFSNKTSSSIYKSVLGNLPLKNHPPQSTHQKNSQYYKHFTQPSFPKNLFSSSSPTTISNQASTIYEYRKALQYTDLYLENGSNENISNIWIDQNLKKLNKRKNKQSTYSSNTQRYKLKATNIHFSHTVFDAKYTRQQKYSLNTQQILSTRKLETSLSHSKNQIRLLLKAPKVKGNQTTSATSKTNHFTGSIFIINKNKKLISESSIILKSKTSDAKETLLNQETSQPQKNQRNPLQSIHSNRTNERHLHHRSSNNSIDNSHHLSASSTSDTEASHSEAIASKLSENDTITLSENIATLVSERVSNQLTNRQMNRIADQILDRIARHVMIEKERTGVL